MKNMAEVLSEHQFMHHIFNGVTQKRYLACSCGEMPLAGDHPTHLADALTAAGFGNLHDAWAEGAVAAIEREHTYGAEEKAKFDNPYPKP